MALQDNSKEIFIVRNANYDGYNAEFTELTGMTEVTIEQLEHYFGSLYDKAGSVIYKCVPIFRIENSTVLKPPNN